MAVKAAAKLSSFVPICHNLMETRKEKKSVKSIVDEIQILYVRGLREREKAKRESKCGGMLYEVARGVGFRPTSSL